MTKTKIIFMGTPQFAATVLKGLIDSNQYEILAVVTQPDRKVGRKQELRMTPVKELALTVNLPVLQPEKLSGSVEMTQIMTLLESGEVGIVTAAFGQFLPGKLLDVAQFAVNTHASLLPKYRGGAPIHYAIMNGEKEAGVTIMEMIRKMDAGDMIAQDSTPILEDDNVGTMFEKLALVGRDLLLETLPKYLSGQLKAQAQNEDEVTFSPNISPEEEKIDWNKSVGNLQAGEIVEKTKKSLKVATGEGLLELLFVQPAGKPKMDIVSFLNGLGQKIQVGDKFGD